MESNNTLSKRLLVVGDSMPLPTKELKYVDTWLHLVMENFPNLEVVEKCVRARSVSTLTFEDYDVLEWYAPDIIILHLGISDCAPRLLHRNKLWVKALQISGIGRLYFNILRKFRGRKMKYADIMPNEFYEHLDRYAKRAAPIKIGMVKISNVVGRASNRSPHWNEAVTIYNNILDEVAQNNPNVTIIDGLDGNCEEDYQSDGFHLMKSGQAKIYTRISEFLKATL